MKNRLNIKSDFFIFHHFFKLQITSKGKIVSFGTQERIKDLEYEHLTFQITQAMVPSARLIVYYIVTEEGAAELVADSVWLNVEQRCGNNLDVSSRKKKKIQVLKFVGMHSFYGQILSWT